MRTTWGNWLQVISLHSADRDWNRAKETSAVTSLQNFVSNLASKQIVWAISVLYWTIWQLIVSTTAVPVQAVVIFQPCMYSIKSTSGVAVDIACTLILLYHAFLNRSTQSRCDTMSNLQFHKFNIKESHHCRLLDYSIYLYILLA